MRAQSPGRRWATVLAGWIAIWALYALLIGPANPLHPNQSYRNAMLISLRSMVIAAPLSLGVRWIVDRVEWSDPLRVRFLVTHAIGALLFSVAWFVFRVLLEMQLSDMALVIYHAMLVPSLVLGAMLYVMIAGAMYATRSTARASHAEALAAQSQLAVLRNQVNPHFLFNALHSVVHLIPREPATASRAAEELAGLLRTAVEEKRDEVTLDEELRFVDRYLSLEQLRFGERLEVKRDVDSEAQSAELPAYALQTLVENAVRHGAAPRAAPTTIEISAKLRGDMLEILVSDNGAGTTVVGMKSTGGTGLQRLRDRLAALYDGDAHLMIEAPVGGGFRAKLQVPQEAI